jgi:hypothetical protein
MSYLNDVNYSMQCKEKRVGKYFFKHNSNVDGAHNGDNVDRWCRNNVELELESFFTLLAESQDTETLDSQFPKTA